MFSEANSTHKCTTGLKLNVSLIQLHSFGLFRVPQKTPIVLGVLVAKTFLAGIPRQFSTQGGVGPPHAFRNFPNGFVLLLHRVLVVAFGHGQLSITPFHLGTASFGRPAGIISGRPKEAVPRLCESKFNEWIFLEENPIVLYASSAIIFW
jgi:hypothetical protein